MSIEATAWLDGETTDTLAGGSPATPADPTPWGGDELDSSAALPEIVPEGGTPTPIPPTDPTPWPTDGLVAGGGSCCCPAPPATCYCPMANTVCVTTSGVPAPALAGPWVTDGSWTYTYGGPVATFYGWASAGWTSLSPDFVGVYALTGTTACTGTNSMYHIAEERYYGSNFNPTLVGSIPYTGPILSCTQRDGGGATPTHYMYYAGEYSGRRWTITACQDNSYPGGPPWLGLAYDWDYEADVVFVGWRAVDLDASTAVPPPGYGGVGPIYSARTRPPPPTVVSCTADEIVLTVPWTRWQYKEEGIRTRVAFFSPPPAAHNGTVTLNTLTEGTCTVTITRGACLVDGPEGGGGFAAAVARAAIQHPEAARLAAADPLLRGGCCG